MMNRSLSRHALGFYCLASSIFLNAQNTVQLELVEWANGLGTALDITHCGDGRLFVARQYGAIFIITDSNQVSPTPFLDISSQVLYNGERGLLGMVFDPDYATNGHFYVNYTTGTGNGTTRISRFTVSANPNVADPSSEEILLTLPQPDPIHQSGSLNFGPDGYLYVALGDGGGASDPNDYGQDPTNLFGTIIRIDPLPDGTYAIPADNPFVGNTDGWREEIWAYGLRNPYRMGIDPLNGDLWIGDVGQSLWEEISYWPGGDNSGPNFGWRCYEGFNPFILTGCGDPSNYVFPLIEHAHSVNGGNFCAIVGGEVYRGQLYPRLQGRHYYTDFCSGEIRVISPDGSGGWNFSLGIASGLVGNSSIGTDVNGEMYLTNNINGRVYKIKDKCPMPDPVITVDGSELSSSMALSYQWYLNGQPILNATDPVYVPVVSGFYSVLAGFGGTCAYHSEPVQYIITGQSEIIGSDWRIHPQPAGCSLTVVSSDEDATPVVVTLFDASGRAAFSGPWPAGSDRAELDLTSLSNGPYVIDVRDARGQSLLRRLVSVAR